MGVDFWTLFFSKVKDESQRFYFATHPIKLLTETLLPEKAICTNVVNKAKQVVLSNANSKLC